MNSPTQFLIHISYIFYLDLCHYIYLCKFLFSTFRLIMTEERSKRREFLPLFLLSIGQISEEIKSLFVKEKSFLLCNLFHPFLFSVGEDGNSVNVLLLNCRWLLNENLNIRSLKTRIVVMQQVFSVEDKLRQISSMARLHFVSVQTVFSQIAQTFFPYQVPFNT